MRRLPVFLLILALSGCSAILPNLRTAVAGWFTPEVATSKRQLYIDAIPVLIEGLCQTTANRGSAILRFGLDAVRHELDPKDSQITIEEICAVVQPGQFVIATAQIDESGPGMVRADHIKIQTKGIE